METLKFNLRFMEVVKRNWFLSSRWFSQELNTVFEFYGDYWHCHPDHFPDENAQHPSRKDDDKDYTPFTIKKKKL